MATRSGKVVVDDGAVAESEAWTEDELREVRSDLVARRQELQDEYDRSMRSLQEYQQTAIGEGGGDDSADVGSKTLEREQELALANNNMDLLRQVDHALARLDAGSYGVCETCGKAIPKARLQVFPSATQDVTCKQREERH